MEDEDEMAMEDLEALLYSQVHFAYDDNAHDAASDPATEHVFSVKPYSENREEDTSGFVSLDLTGASSLSLPTAFSSEIDNDSDVEILGATRGSTSSSQRVRRYHQDSSPEVIALSDVRTSSPEVIVINDPINTAIRKHGSKRKFDLEAELGIPNTPREKRKLSSPDEIDTITIKPKIQKKKSLSETGRKTAAPQFLSLKASAADEMEPKSKCYKQTLKRMFSSKIAASSKQTNVKGAVVIDSDSSASSSSDSSSTSEDSMDSDIALDLLVGGISASDDGRPKSKTAAAKLELNWNVSGSDRQTIHIANNEAWKVNDADEMKRSMGSRYYAPKPIRCNNCNEEGHLSRRCPLPRKRPNCSLCGESNHMVRFCTNRLCFNCNQPGHRGTSCPETRRDRWAKCARCQMRGHSEDNCPDHWRQYHATVKVEQGLVQTKKLVNSRKYCPNCAKRGHFAYECRNERMDKLVFPTYPFIIKYSASDATKKVSAAGPSKERSHKVFCSDSDTDESPKKFRYSYVNSNRGSQQRYHDSTPSTSYVNSNRGSQQRYHQPSSSIYETPHNSRTHHGDQDSPMYGESDGFLKLSGSSCGPSTSEGGRRWQPQSGQRPQRYPRGKTAGAYSLSRFSQTFMGRSVTDPHPSESPDGQKVRGKQRLHKKGHSDGEKGKKQHKKGQIDEEEDHFKIVKRSKKKNKNQSPNLEKNKKKASKLEKNHKQSPKLEKNKKQSPKWKKEKQSPKLKKKEKQSPELKKKEKQSPKLKKKEKQSPKLEYKKKQSKSERSEKQTKSKQGKHAVASSPMQPVSPKNKAQHSPHTHSSKKTWTPQQGDKKTEGRKRKRSRRGRPNISPGPSGSGGNSKRQSLTVTSKGGFRTTALSKGLVKAFKQQ